MSTARHHLRPADSEREALVLGACGFTARSPAHLVDARSDVTCRACLRLMDREAIGSGRAVEAPFTPGPAVPVVPQTWDERGVEIVERSVAGDDGVAPEGWRTLNGALAAWWSVYSSSLVASSSRPPSSGGGGPRHDHTPAAIAHRMTVLPVEIAIVAACADGRTFAGDAEGNGALALDSRACRFVVESYQANRSAADTAARLASALGLPDEAVTAHQVGLVYRGVRAHVEAELVARGLIARTRVSHTRERASSAEVGDEMALPPGYDLDGWKAIAGAAGLAESHCRAMSRAASDPLPVHEMTLPGATRPRILGRASEIRAWLARQVKPRAGAA